eukprot:2740521-Rhodomonas_salina.2
MPGTERADGATRRPLLRTIFRRAATAWYCPRSPYAMSGTDLAHSDDSLRACYEMSGTDLTHGAICLRDIRF